MLLLAKSTASPFAWHVLQSGSANQSWDMNLIISVDQENGQMGLNTDPTGTKNSKNASTVLPTIYYTII